MRDGEAIACGIVSGAAFALFLPGLSLFQTFACAAILGFCVGMLVSLVRDVL